MNLHFQNQNPFQTQAVRTAALGKFHSYRFDGETVYLNSMFTVIDADAHSQQWALQLWACPQAPDSARSFRGQKVAEAALPPIGEIADDSEGFELAAQATIPAGSGDHHMVLVLASGRDGRFDDLQDFSVYPRTERFCQPALAGSVSFSISGDQVRISVDRVENPRAIGTQSGTLALELWAMEAPYEGGAFQGAPLAGVAFDGLAGQWNWTHLNFDLPYAAPPAGTWQVVLMLREWTAAGYVTRDFTNFSVPLVIAEPVREVVTEPVVSAIPAPVPARKPVTKSPAPASTRKPAAKATAPAPTEKPAAKTKTAKPLPTPKPLKTAKNKSQTAAISVNQSSKDELKAVKGLSGKVVEEILRRRPFKSLEDLISCKGMGKKLLNKLRDKLSL